MKEEAEAKIRLLKDKTDAEIQRLIQETFSKSTAIREATKKDLGLLQVTSERKTQELEDKRTARKRKHEDDYQDIESEFATRLKSLEKSCITGNSATFRASGSANRSSASQKPVDKSIIID
ncbi:hypothetical protein INS49_004732 [Diaporthe citri]|uniref:uncharacterized protein n=1 Tax=Diaporthe citri TaxID=83186 RepID=UPI001C801901|nr:uncharacterized protein INS49_004732 [Diaporthe citri]KAG6354714.1 hypothetical protein INS49_004732 [Diaporthe citri]